jgi:hypothetical protein
LTGTEAAAEVFCTAFQALKRKEREAVYQRIRQDEGILEDIRYALIIEERKNEQTTSLKDSLNRKQVYRRLKHRKF